jgi:hypothetical protein
MKVSISVEEFYPFPIIEKAEEEQSFRTITEIPDDLLNRYDKMYEELMNIREELSKFDDRFE